MKIAGQSSFIVRYIALQITWSSVHHVYLLPTTLHSALADPTGHRPPNLITVAVRDVSRPRHTGS